MPDRYITIPDAWWNANVGPLADGAKVTIGNGVEIHRADGPLPDDIATALGSYKLLRCSDPADFTAAVSFHPSNLFAGGEDGFVFLPSPSTSFESANNTDPAEVGDGVRFQECSSGRTTRRTGLQATSGDRPILALDGSTYVLEFEQDTDESLTIGAYQAATLGGITLFARIKIEAGSSGDRHILSAQPGGGNNVYQFRINGVDGRLSLIGWQSGGSGTLQANSASALSTGVWLNVCAVFTPTNARVWVDTMTDAGVSGTAANGAGTVSQGSPTITVGQGPSGSGFDGLMAMLFSINRPLTEAERLNLASFASAL